MLIKVLRPYDELIPTFACIPIVTVVRPSFKVAHVTFKMWLPIAGSLKIKSKQYRKSDIGTKFCLVIKVVLKYHGPLLVVLSTEVTLSNKVKSLFHYCYQCTTVESVLRDHCHERPPVFKDQIFLTEGPTFQCN